MPTTLGKTDQIREALAADPHREWTPVALGRELGISTHFAATRLLYLADRGEATRIRSGRARSLYRGVVGPKRASA